MIKPLLRILLVFLLFHPLGAALAQQPGWVAEREELQGIDDQVQTLKKEIIEINNELLLLEEKLLFPSTTQISVFVSLEAQLDFRLDSLELKIDEQAVAQYIYTFRELEALRKGGVQRLHTGNLPTGNHRIAAVIRGKTAGGDPFEQRGDVAVNKEVDPKFVEMRIIAAGGAPRITFRDW